MKNYSSLTDRELLEQYRIGDQTSATVFFERYFETLLRHCVLQGIEPTSAQDIVQESLITFFVDIESAHPKFNIQKNPLPWLKTIVRRRAIDLIRALTRKGTYTTDYLDEIATSATCSFTTVEAAEYQQEQIEQILSFLDTRPLDDQILFKRRFLTPVFSFKKFCVESGMEPNEKNLHDLRQRLFRLLVAIRKRFKNE